MSNLGEDGDPCRDHSWEHGFGPAGYDIFTRHIKQVANGGFGFTGL